MTGIHLLAEFMHTGKWMGVGVDSQLRHVDEILHAGFIEEGSDHNWLRRDYGLFEVDFAHSSEWTVRGITIEIHRLASDPELLDEWNRERGFHLERYTTWIELRVAVLDLANELEFSRVEQGDFIEYRNAFAKTSAMVVANDEERDEWPGGGDLWSLHLG